MVPMSRLRAAPFGLALGDLVVATATATNAIGTSAPSVENVAGAAVKTEPGEPLPASRVDPGTSDLQITATYPAPTDGGSPLTSVALYWDAASGGVTWTELVGETSPSLAVTYTVTAGVVRGALHRFRHRAANIFGWGALSPEVVIKAATRPDRIAAVETSV
jgi:hypothetical protein